jgi:hypothetical protein
MLGVGSVGDASGANGGYLLLPLDAMLQQPRPAGVLVGTGGAALSPAAAAAAAAGAPVVALPEVGLRVSRGAWSAGGHFGAGAPFPFRAWAAWFGGDGSRGGGSVTAGVEMSGASALSLLRSAGGAAPSAAPTAPTPPPPAAAALAYGCAVALRQPLFEMSLAVDGAAGYDVVAGYTQSFVVRRAVYNPLEEARVKGVYQHVDLSVEARKALRPPFAAALDLAAAWHWNRCVQLKARLGTQRDVALSLALRTWTEPSLVLCLTGSVDGKSGEPGVGVALTVAGGGEREYRAAALGQQRAAPSLMVPAKEHLNEKRREVL